MNDISGASMNSMDIIRYTYKSTNISAVYYPLQPDLVQYYCYDMAPLVNGPSMQVI